MHTNTTTTDQPQDSAPRETHEVEIASAVGPSRLLIRRDPTDELLSVKIVTPDYNVVVRVKPEQLLLAARTLAELPDGKSNFDPIQASAGLQRVLDHVAAERARQNIRYESGDEPIHLADANTSPGVKLPVLTERFLAALKEIQMLNLGSTIALRDQSRRNLRHEAIRSAAAWSALAESLQP